MKGIWVFRVWLFLVLVVLGCCDSDNVEGESVKSIASDSKKSIASNNNNNTANPLNGGSEPVLDSKKGEKSKKERVRVKGVESASDRSNSSNRVADVRRKKGESSDLSKLVTGGEKKKTVDNGLEEPKEGDKLEGDGGDSVSSTLVRKDGSRVEECDPSNRCIDEVNKLVACLRVPGNESPHLSLLIQNQGKGPLTVTISAPEFVKLERTKAELQEKEDTQVKVSIGDGVTETLINLTSGKGRCSLDFRDLIPQNSQNDSHQVPEITYTNFFTRTSTIVVISLAALLIVASSWICISLRRRRLLSNGAKYERLDMELPVAVVGGKGEFGSDDGWDNSWGDDWGDEEAPRTPTMPVTPSLSSKGLAARRLNKDGWKD